MPAENVFCIPSFVDVPGMEIDQELRDVQPIRSKVNELDCCTDSSEYHFKNRIFLNYDNDSSCQPPSLVEADSTKSSSFSVGNATFGTTHECFEMEVD